MQHQDWYIVFILFDNLSYLITKVIDASENYIQHSADKIVTSNPTASSSISYKPVVETSYLDSLEIHQFQSLVDLVCSKTHIYVIL